jgi:hypothetical protein
VSCLPIFFPFSGAAFDLEDTGFQTLRLVVNIRFRKTVRRGTVPVLRLGLATLTVPWAARFLWLSSLSLGQESGM